jgi:hypothetical protein
MLKKVGADVGRDLREKLDKRVLRAEELVKRIVANVKRFARIVDEYVALVEDAGARGLINPDDEHYLGSALLVYALRHYRELEWLSRELRGDVERAKAKLAGFFAGRG